MSHNITVEVGNPVRLPTAGKYCDRDIIVRATVATEDFNLARSILDRTITEYVDNKITTVGNYGFIKCSKLVNVEIPNITGLGRNAFSQCISLKRIELPNLITLGEDCFIYCNSLEYVDVGKVTSLPSWSLSNCNVLKTVVIRKTDAIATMVVTNAFSNTPIASGTGYVYVPDSLVNSYKTATNWSTYANQIKPLSELGS